MSGVDIAVIVIVGLGVIAAVGYLIYRKLKHKGGCCGCDACGENCSCCKGKKE